MRPAIRRVLPALVISLALYATHADAFDLNGAWASDASICGKIFVKKKDNISIARDSDLYGSGFIVQGGKIRGKMAACGIKSQKEQSGILNMVAVCSTDIALSTVQFTLKIDDDNKVTRLFSGLPELSVSYVRCAL